MAIFNQYSFFSLETSDRYTLFKDIVWTFGVMYSPTNQKLLNEPNEPMGNEQV